MLQTLQWKLCCGSEFSSPMSPSLRASPPVLSFCCLVSEQLNSFSLQHRVSPVCPDVLGWSPGVPPMSVGLPVCTELSTAVPAPIHSPHVTDLGNVTGERECRANLCLTGFSLPKAKVHSLCSCWYKIIAFAFLIAVGKG